MYSAMIIGILGGILIMFLGYVAHEVDQKELEDREKEEEQ